MDMVFSERANNDLYFSEAIRKINSRIPILLGYFFYFDKHDIQELSTDWEQQFQHIFDSKITAKISTVKNPPEEISTGIGALSSHPLYAKATRNHGFFDITTDSDGTTRRTHLIGKYKNTLFPSFALKTASLATQKEIVVQFGPVGIENIFFDHDPLPVNAKGEFLINYLGPSKTFPTYSFVDIYQQKIDASILQNKVIIMGVTAKAVGDTVISPFDSAHVGVEIHANVIENLLHQNYLTRPSGIFTFELLFVFFMGILLGLVFQKMHSRTSLFFIILLVGVYIVGDYQFLFKKHILANGFLPLCHLIFVYLSATAYKYFVEEKRSREIKAAFQHYVSPAVVNEILKHPTELKLGGEKRELTVLFSDIRGFTTLSEKLPPEKLTELLNIYLTEMTQCVFDQRGMLDKYVGDELMALFGAPLKTNAHTLDACLCAINMIQKLSTVRKIWESHGVTPLNIGIGIHTGEMIVGNMGSTTIFDYTVIGDSVNLGSRLEGTNKVYGTQIIISEDVQKQVTSNIFTRELDYIRVRGKKEPVRIYEVWTAEPTTSQKEALKQFQEALLFYRSKKWSEAAALFKKIISTDVPSKAFLERCELYLKTPPPTDWDGVFAMQTK